MTDESRTPRSKVARAIDKYDLEGVGRELEHRWTRTEERFSLRELAEYFNRRLLLRALEAEDADPLEGEVENLYALLNGDETTSGVQQEARHHLEERGVDVDDLESDFVSYQSIRTYLQKYRNAELPETRSSIETEIGRKRKTIQRLVSRLSTVTERSLSNLGNSPEFTAGEFDVLVSIRVYCTECNTQKPLADLFSEYGCDCN